MRQAVMSVLCGTLAVACSGDMTPDGGKGGGAGTSSSVAGAAGTASTVGGSSGLGTAGSSSVTGGAAAGSGFGGSPSGGSGSLGGGGGAPAAGGTAGVAGAGGAAGSAGSGAGGGGGAGGANAALMKIFDGSTLNGWTEYPAGNWKAVDGTLKATGLGRGFIATNADYTHYRLLFSLKPGGTGNHAPCVLQFCTRPAPGGKALDACGGIQFQPPKGGTWDYRPGKNNDGKGLFTHVGEPGPADADGFYHCEVVANATTGEAKLACGGKDVLHFKDMTAGKVGPWAIQTHNPGFSDAYKDIFVEEGLASDDYITVKP